MAPEGKRPGRNAVGGVLVAAAVVASPFFAACTLGFDRFAPGADAGAGHEGASPDVVASDVTIDGGTGADHVVDTGLPEDTAAGDAGVGGCADASG